VNSEHSTYITSNRSTTTKIHIIPVALMFLPQTFNTRYTVTGYIITNVQ